MQVLAYFLIGAATLAIGFAGFHGFQNKSVTIIAAGIGGILTVASACCFWQAIVWLDEAKSKPSTNEHTAPTPPTKFPTTTSSPESLPTPSKPKPTHSPSSSATSLTPTQIFEKISSSSVYNREDVRKAFVGLSVDWTLFFASASASQTGENMLILLRDKPWGETGELVSCRVPLEGNERFPLMNRTDQFRVRGIIEEPPIVAINLKNVSIEQLHDSSQ